MKIRPGDMLAAGSGAGLLGLRLAFADKGKRYDYALIGYYNPNRDGYEYWDRPQDYMILNDDKMGQFYLDKVKPKTPPDLKRKIIQGLLTVIT